MKGVVRNLEKLCEFINKVVVLVWEVSWEFNGLEYCSGF